VTSISSLETTPRSRGHPIPGFPDRLNNRPEDCELTARELQNRSEYWSIRAERARRGERLSDTSDIDDEVEQGSTI
jgi:hypothetical protein